MPRYCQLVIGPAGSGKSTYCTEMQRHCQMIKRSGVHVINLDPAAETFSYEPLLDVRDLIGVDDVLESEDLLLGPNGALVFCMEYLLDHVDEWLLAFIDGLNEDETGQLRTDGIAEDEYIFFDCPGQLELYTHLDLMKTLIKKLQSRDFNVCAVYLMDSHFVTEPNTFVAGALAAMSAMVHLEVAHVNVLSKCDLLSADSRKQIDRFLLPDFPDLMRSEPSAFQLGHGKDSSFSVLNSVIAGLLEEWSLVKFVALNLKKVESLTECLQEIDHTLQYGEDLEPREPAFDQADGSLTEQSDLVDPVDQLNSLLS